MIYIHILGCARGARAVFVKRHVPLYSGTPGHAAFLQVLFFKMRLSYRFFSPPYFLSCSGPPGHAAVVKT